MHCSHCGFENPAGHRFCGMCGTRLSQRPVTAPAAQSTLSFTRLPIESPPQASSTFSSYAPPGTPATVEDGATSKLSAPPVEESASQAVVPILENMAPSAPAIQEAEPSGPPVKSHFTDAQEAESLEQFIAGFRYTPPSEGEELSMTGDKPILDAGAEYEPPTPVSLSEDDAPEVEPPIATAGEAVPSPAATLESVTEQPPPFATKSVRTPPSESGRVLDLSVPATQEASGDRGLANEGLSVLGLDDPLPAANDEGEAFVPRRRRWWIWLAVIIILSVAAFGFLEWRAETYQIDLGPLRNIRNQTERPKTDKSAGATAAPSRQTPNPNSGNTAVPPANQPANQGTTDSAAPKPQ